MPDTIDLYDRGTAWVASKLPAAAAQLDSPTPCEGWDVRTLLNHLLAGQRMFAGAAKGEPAAPPTGDPPELVGDDPVAQYEEARQATIAAHREPGAQNTDQILAIGLADQVVHGWDLAKATGQDATIPPDLAEAAFRVVDGRIRDEVRGPGKLFASAVTVDDQASAQDKLIGYCGRQP